MIVPISKVATEKLKTKGGTIICWKLLVEGLCDLYSGIKWSVGMVEAPNWEIKQWTWGADNEHHVDIVYNALDVFSRREGALRFLEYVSYLPYRCLVVEVECEIDDLIAADGGDQVAFKKAILTKEALKNAVRN